MPKHKGQGMPRTPDAGGIPLPPSWPPFNRDCWHDRARCLIDSLSRHGHEGEDYASVPPALNLTKGALEKAAAGREESSIGLAKKAAGGGNADDAPPAKGGEEDEDPNRLEVKPTRVLKTYEQRRKYIAKAMDMHRHTIGGGRSGRRGRAECIAFLRYCLEVLDEQYADAMEQEEAADGAMVGNEEQEEEESSSEEEEESEEEEGGEDEEEEEEVEESEAEISEEEQAPKRGPGRPPKSPPKKKGPGRPRKEDSSSPPPKKKPRKTKEPEAKIVMNEQEFFDQHNDLCEVCNTAGELLCCATCNLVFHIKCARPRLVKEPPDDWKCSYCWAAGVMGGKKDGKERRKAAQACREMERMRRELRGKRGDEVASIESDDVMSDDDMDKKPAAKPSRSPRGLAAAAEGNQVSLTEAAASGCRKCQRELRTGEKDRKTHDDQCPRKWRSVGKPPGASPSSGVREEESEAEEEEEDARGTDVVGGVSLEEAAEAGCVKCQLQLETGEKTRKVHADHCPRKYRGAVHKKSPEAEAVAMEVDVVKGEDQGRKVAAEKTFSNVEVAATPASPRKPPPQDPDAAVAEAPRKRGPGRPPSKKKKAGRPPSKRPTSPKNPASLADAAAAGCDKCKRELETGEKSRKTHDDHCPRKWRAKGTSPASAEAAALKSVEKSQSSPAQAAAKAPETPTRSSRRGKRTREQMLEKNATDEDEESAIAAMGLLAEATAKESGDNDDEGEVKPLRGGGGSGSEEDKKGLVPVEVLSAELTGLGKQSAYNEDVDVELAKPLRGGGRTPKVKVEDGEEVKAGTGSSPGATQPPDSPSRTSGRERKKPNVLDLGVGPAKEWGTPAADSDSPEPLRGGARPKKEDSATSDAAEAPAPARRGRPPTKQTKKGQKENAKRAPIKKETNNAVKGIGSAGRKPSALFDCPVCLDINKNKLCCYCACRLCFNKFGKEQTILCDKCDQEYHTFCLGLPKIPDEEWVCPACIDDEKKKKIAAQRKKEREARKKIEEEKRVVEEAKKKEAQAKRKAAYQERKKQEEEQKRIEKEKRKIAYEKRKQKEAEMRAQGIPVRRSKAAGSPSSVITRKRGPGRPPKSEIIARQQAQQQLLLQQKSSGRPVKRGRGRPRKDGSDPVPRKLQAKYEISDANLYVDTGLDEPVERSRSGRKIQKTVFHDEVEGGGLMKRPRLDDDDGAAPSSYVPARSAAAAAKSAMNAGSKKESRRKPGARECMQITRKFGMAPIEQKHFDILMDYSKRGKVDHLIRLRERMDEHSRFLEAQLAGLEARVLENQTKEKGETSAPAAKPKAGDA